MPRFILLNGPPGIGKSTLARRYADERFGVLNLDVDRLRGMIGRSRDHFAEIGEIVRPLALGMAITHLRGGRDVIMPQYLGRLGEIERFEAAAREAGARFHELVLMDGRAGALARFARRGEDGADREWHRQVRGIVARNGGEELLGRMYDQLVEVLRQRPTATLLPSRAGVVDQAYRDLVTALDGSAVGHPRRV